MMWKTDAEYPRVKKYCSFVRGPEPEGGRNGETRARDEVALRRQRRSNERVKQVIETKVR